MLPQRLFPPFVFSVLHLESDGVSILYTFLALLNSARGETALYISRSNGNNLKFFLIEHPYFYAPTFSRDLYEILMIRYILNSKLWGKKYVVKTQVHKSSIFKLVLLFIRYSFKVAPFMSYAF